LILSRKGFDSASGGCPSPIFPDGSLLSMPIPDRSSPVRYADLSRSGRNLGDLVERLPGCKQRPHYGAHLDPDLHPDWLPRAEGWHPSLGQRGIAQGHLTKQGVRPGDLFLFWGVFRRVDEALRWCGRPMHVLWGWLQVGDVAPVDRVVRADRDGAWCWAARHPHLAFEPDPSNTLYVAGNHLEIPGLEGLNLPAAGAFDVFTEQRVLTAEDAARPSLWSLPAWFLPRGRPPLSYHLQPHRWQDHPSGLQLEVVARGQEFVLNAAHYPEAAGWAAEQIAGR
jgi:hypothetical protein